MTCWGKQRLGLFCFAFWGIAPFASAQSVSNYAVQVSAVVQTNPPQITLSWPGDSNSTGYTVYRKKRDETAWGSGIALAPNAIGYTDTNVVVGGAYEYRIVKSAPGYTGFGYIYSGAEVPLVESRGTIVLVVDNSFSSSLSNELARLQQDLVGDGWFVIRHDVARTDSVTNVKALILADYGAAPADVKAVFLFGHVPVPYSGDFTPDDHSNHVGAWPADVYYGDMDGAWTDSTVNDTSASDPRNHNVPGDGKFDQSTLPSDVELEVGRVDLANLPAFPLNETELLRQYLNKDHRFRNKLTTAQFRGLIDDNLGVSAGQPLAVNGWRNFAPFFGAANTFSGDLLTTLATQSYLWAYGCGAGTYTSVAGVGDTTNFVTQDPQAMFTMFFGSYLGDWDSQNNFLRAALGTTNFILASVWGGRPNWEFHHMALGETIGFSTRVTQNNDGTTYSANGFQRYVHIALMGDPTLRMHIVASPANLVAATNMSGGVALHWDPSPEAVLGYGVYRGPNEAGPFVRLNSALVTDTNYVDPELTHCTYMVRAVKLEVSGSGSYTNASQGIFQNFDAPGAPQVLVVSARSARKVYGEPLPDLTAFYSGFVNGDTTNNLTAQAVLTTPATAASPAGSYPIHVSGAFDTNYAISFVDGTLTILPAATIGLLTSSANPSLPGQEVTFTFTLNVVAPGAGSPTGTVQFSLDGTNAGDPVSLIGDMASFSNSTLEHGSHWVQADYSGDGNFSPATSFLSPGQLVNTPPVAGPDTIERDATNGVSVLADTLLSNDSDADNDPFLFTGVNPTSGAGGIVSSSNNWIYYTPPAEFTNADTFTYTISDVWGASATGMVTVKILGSDIPSPKLSIVSLGNGSNSVFGEGIPGGVYRIQSAGDLTNPNWQTNGSATADSSGFFQFTDSAISTRRFYRSVYP